MEVSIEDDYIRAASALFCHHGAKRQSIKKVEKETYGCHVPRPHVLVATINWLVRSSHAFFAFEQGVAAEFAQPGQHRHIVPEGEH